MKPAVQKASKLRPVHARSKPVEFEASISPARHLANWTALFLADVVAYWPALHGGLLCDDTAHITAPHLRSLYGLWRIWSDVRATQQYYPLLHSAFWIEHRLWGDEPAGYHFLNLFLHCAAAALAALALRRLR